MSVVPAVFRALLTYFEATIIVPLSSLYHMFSPFPSPAITHHAPRPQAISQSHSYSILHTIKQQRLMTSADTRDSDRPLRVRSVTEHYLHEYIARMRKLEESGNLQ